MIKKSVAKNPVAKKPMAKNPVAKKPVVKKPMAKKPVVKKPMAKKPVVKKLMAKNHVVKKPMAKNPVVKKPMAKNPMVKGSLAKQKINNEIKDTDNTYIKQIRATEGVSFSIQPTNMNTSSNYENKTLKNALLKQGFSNQKINEFMVRMKITQKTPITKELINMFLRIN